MDARPCNAKLKRAAQLRSALRDAEKDILAALHSFSTLAIIMSTAAQAAESTGSL